MVIADGAAVVLGVGNEGVVEGAKVGIVSFGASDGVGVAGIVGDKVIGTAVIGELVSGAIAGVAVGLMVMII